MAGDRDVIGEGVLLGELLTVVVPGAAQLAAAAHVGHGPHHTAIQQRQPGDRESRVGAGLVGAVGVLDHGSRDGGVQVRAPHQGDRDACAVIGRGPVALHRVLGALIPAEHRSFAAQNGLTHADVTHTVVSGLCRGDVIDPRGRHEGRVGHPHHGVVVAGGDERGGEQLFVEVRLRTGQTLCVSGAVQQRIEGRARDEPHPRGRLGTQGHHQMRGRGLTHLDPGMVADGNHVDEIDIGDTRTGLGQWHETDAGVRRLMVVSEQNIVGAGHGDGFGRVQHAITFRNQGEPLLVRRGYGADAVLAVLGARGDHHEPLLVRGQFHAQPQAGIVLLVQQLVLLGGGTDHMSVHTPGPPGIVDHRVDQLCGVGREERAVGGLPDPVGQQLPGGQILDVHRESLVSGGVLGPGQMGSVLGNAECAQGIELMALGGGIRVQQRLFPGQRHTGLHRGRCPGKFRVPDVGCGDPAEDLMRPTLDRAGEVPPRSIAGGYGHVGFPGAVLDLTVDILAQRLQMRRHGLRVLVLTVQVSPHVVRVLVSQPLEMILEHMVMKTAVNGASNGYGVWGHLGTHDPSLGSTAQWCSC